MKRTVLLSCLCAVVMLLSGCKNKNYEYPFQNPKLSFDKRADNLLSLLTPEEKIGLTLLYSRPAI